MFRLYLYLVEFFSANKGQYFALVRSPFRCIEVSLEGLVLFVCWRKVVVHLPPRPGDGCWPLGVPTFIVSFHFCCLGSLLCEYLCFIEVLEHCAGQVWLVSLTDSYYWSTSFGCLQLFSNLLFDCILRHSTIYWLAFVVKFSPICQVDFLILNPLGRSAEFHSKGRLLLIFVLVNVSLHQPGDIVRRDNFALDEPTIHPKRIYLLILSNILKSSNNKNQRTSTWERSNDGIHLVL